MPATNAPKMASMPMKSVTHADTRVSSRQRITTPREGGPVSSPEICCTNQSRLHRPTVGGVQKQHPSRILPQHANVVAGRRGGSGGGRPWGRGEGGCNQYQAGRSRVTIDPCIPTMPGQGTAGEDWKRYGVSHVEGGTGTRHLV